MRTENIKVKLRDGEMGYDPDAPKRAGPETAYARFGEADLAPDLAEGEPAPVREHEHATLDGRELAERLRDDRPAVVAGCGSPPVLSEIADPLERDLDVGLRQVRGLLLSRPERAAGRAGERVALAQRIQDLAAHAPRCIRAERGAAVAAVTLRRLHEADEPPGNEVLTVGAAAPRIDRPRRDGSGELQVRDDAVIAERCVCRWLPRAADRRHGSGACQ